jgi:hypothetical protein
MNGGTAPCILNLSITLRSVVKFMQRPLHLRERSWYLFNRRLGISEPVWTLHIIADSATYGEWKDIYILPGIEPRLLSRSERFCRAYLRRYFIHLLYVHPLLGNVFVNKFPQRQILDKQWVLKLGCRCKHWNWAIATNAETELPPRVLKLSYRYKYWNWATAACIETELLL